MPRDFARHGEWRWLNLTGPWFEPTTAPSVWGRLGLDDQAVGVKVGDVCVSRLPREEVFAMLQRTARLHGTSLPFTLTYEDTR